MTSPDPPQPTLAADSQPRPTSPAASRQQPAQAEGQRGEDRPHDDHSLASDERGPALPPLFTLIHNATSKTTHHPHIHYIFTDDDPDLLTQALSTSDPLSADKEASRSILLDLAPGEDGSWKVAHAASLSADWAVVDAGLRKMEDGEGQGEGPGALMLKIEGVEGEEADIELSGESSSGAKAEGKEDYNTLIEQFEKHMVVMRRVVEAGQSRRREMTHVEGDVYEESGVDEKAQLGNKVGD